jgi:hypothetical protein
VAAAPTPLPYTHARFKGSTSFTPAHAHDCTTALANPLAPSSLLLCPALPYQALSLAPDVAPLYLLRIRLLEDAGGGRTDEAMVDFATALFLQPSLAR